MKDLHIHSCLSPCGDDEMTPYNLVGLAKLMGYDTVALTDHNSCLNCPAAISAGEAYGVKVIPGMELCTSEEVHIICLFEEMKSAAEFSRFVRSTVPDIKNRPSIFGRQLICGEDDEVMGEEEILLATASGISVSEVVKIVGEYSGICHPAHIDRPSYSVISNLGAITPEMGFTRAEVSIHGKLPQLFDAHPILKELEIVFSSDAHSLETMLPAEKLGELYIELKTVKESL